MPPIYFPEEQPETGDQYHGRVKSEFAVYFNAGDSGNQIWRRAVYDLEEFRRSNGTGRLVKDGPVGLQSLSKWVRSCKDGGDTRRVIYYCGHSQQWLHLSALLKKLAKGTDARSALSEVLRSKLPSPDFIRFKAIHLDNLIRKGFKSAGDLSLATVDMLQAPPGEALPLLLIQSLLKGFNPSALHEPGASGSGDGRIALEKIESVPLPEAVEIVKSYLLFMGAKPPVMSSEADVLPYTGRDEQTALVLKLVKDFAASHNVFLEARAPLQNTKQGSGSACSPWLLFPFCRCETAVEGASKTELSS